MAADKTKLEADRATLKQAREACQADRKQLKTDHTALRADRKAGKDNKPAQGK